MYKEDHIWSFLLTFVPAKETLAQPGEASFARGGWEFEPGLRHKKRPHMEVSSMLDKSFF